jgi:hypothetical protein
VNEATYSGLAQRAAREAVDEYCPGDTQESIDNAVLAFKSIKLERYSTAIEKDLANFGLRLSTYQSSQSPKTVAIMLRSVLTSLAAAPCGPVGAVLAEVGLNVLTFGSDPDFMSTAAREALRMVANSSQSDPREKQMAVKGTYLGLDTDPGLDSMDMRKSLLTNLAGEWVTPQRTVTLDAFLPDQKTWNVIGRDHGYMVSSPPSTAKA